MKERIIESLSIKEEDIEFWNDFLELKWKEKKPVSHLILQACKEYYKNHADGNPNYQLEQFEDSNFKACPAFYRDKESWNEYLTKLNKEEYKQFDSQLNLLLNLGNRRYEQF